MEKPTASDPAARQDSGKRTVRACVRCRERKVKCSGTDPCGHCSRKGERCRFIKEGNRVLVSERYLRELERTYNTLTDPAATSPVPRRPERAADHVQSRSAMINSTETCTTPRLDTPEFCTPEAVSVGGETNQSHPTVTHGERATETSCPVSIDRRDSLQSWPQISPAQRDATEEEAQEHSRPEFASNPLVARHSVVRDPSGGFRFLGPSSTWSFSRRVLAFLDEMMPQTLSPSDPFNLDGAAYTLNWKRLSFDETPSVNGLPALDYALYLFNTVKFHISQLFRMIDEESFLRELNSFYANRSGSANISRLWFAQYLLILAFGKNFLIQYKAGSAPPGSDYAARAMSLLPDIGDASEDRLLEIEVLCLAALYLQSLDMRITAFRYIGQALRLSFVEGIHREWPAEIVGPELASRCRNVWWTVFILDQEFSALMGAPSSVRYEDITVALPSATDPSTRAAALTLQIHLSRLTARILSTVYGVSNKLDGSFLTETQCVLHSLADMSRELDEVFKARFESSVGGLSRVSTHITLSYHHCIVLTTRPLVMCILQRSILPTGSSKSPHLSLSPPISALLQTCIDSATAILRTLRALGAHDLLESFLPFHLEGVFCSAFILYIIHATLPGRIADSAWLTTAYFVLDSMISKGSSTARLRRDELTHLGILLSPLIARHTPHDSPMAHEAQQSSPNNGSRVADETTHHADMTVYLSEQDPLALIGGLGLSRGEMLELAEQLNIDNVSMPFVVDDWNGQVKDTN